MQIPRPILRLTLAACTAAFLVALGVPSPSAAGPEAKEHLHFRKTYADALLEARIRNLPVLVSRHKDD